MSPLLLLFILGASATTIARPVAPTVTVCQVASHPDDYLGKMAAVEADVLSDLRTGTQLVDSACEHAALLLEAGDWDHRPVALIKDRSYREYEKLHANVVRFNRAHKQIHGEFVGLVQRDPGSNALVLVLERVTNPVVRDAK